MCILAEVRFLAEHCRECGLQEKKERSFSDILREISAELSCDVL